MPRESANEWSCLFCGKGCFSSLQAASECEREAVLEFSNFSMHFLPPITQAIQGMQLALDQLVEGLFVFWSLNFVPGEPVGIQYPESNPSLWPAKIISRDQSSIDYWYVQILQSSSSSNAPGEKIVVVRAENIQRCKPLLYSKRHIPQAIRVLTMPKASYSEPYRIRPEYDAFLGIESADLATDLHDFLVDFIPNYHSIKRQKKLDAFLLLCLLAIPHRQSLCLFKDQPFPILQCCLNIWLACASSVDLDCGICWSFENLSLQA